MAILSGLISTGAAIDQGTGGGIRKTIEGLFSGGGGAGKSYRRATRENLKKVGFIYNNNHPDPWNVNKYGNRALENVVRLFEEYGDVAVQLHNNRQLNDTIASDYSNLVDLAEQKIRSGRSNPGIPGGDPVSMGIETVSEWVPWGVAGLVVITLFGFFFLK